MRKNQNWRNGHAQRSLDGKHFRPSITVTRSNWPKADEGTACAPKTNGIAPQKSETLSRQQLRFSLRTQAHQQITEQYSQIGKKSGLFVGYLDFSRRGRRRVMYRLSQRWYRQIRAKLAENNSGANRGFVKDILRSISLEKAMVAGAGR